MSPISHLLKPPMLEKNILSYDTSPSTYIHKKRISRVKISRRSYFNSLELLLLLLLILVIKTPNPLPKEGFKQKARICNREELRDKQQFTIKPLDGCYKFKFILYFLILQKYMLFIYQLIDQLILSTKLGYILVKSLIKKTKKHYEYLLKTDRYFFLTLILSVCLLYIWVSFLRT